MNKILRNPILPMAMLVSLTACQELPVQNINHAPIHMSKHNYGLGDVQRDIVTAGTNLGWQMRTVKPGLIDATLYSEEQMAQVQINYSTSQYSIHYLNSQNMNYSSKGPGTEKIYEDYNVWVQDLDKAIRKQLIAS